MAKKLMCDPPSGWRFGFPRAVPEEYRKERFYEWLDMVGYPTKVRESMGDKFYCRFWEEDDEDKV
jgi:hypothetical protein